MVSAADASTSPVEPIDLSLNNGNRTPGACVEVMRAYANPESLRRYSDIDNRRLKLVVAELDQVGPEHVYLGNGSGPLLKQCIPHVIRASIQSSPVRVVRHLINGLGYPLVVGSFTYTKIPLQGRKKGLSIRMMPMRADRGFRLQVDDVARELEQRDSFVYVCNPNNPTGQVMLGREALLALIERFPRSTFCVDEAYVQYLTPEQYRPVADLVPAFPNLIVCRSFSFAYGLAGARIGYLLAAPALVETLDAQVTGYRLGQLQQDLAIAALTDPMHLDEVRRQSAEGREQFAAVLRQDPGVEVFESATNFVLARFTDGRTGVDLVQRMLQAGVRIKSFVNVESEDYGAYFRVTLGTPSENARAVRALEGALASTRLRPAA